MSSIPFDLKFIRGFVFDVDGVISHTVSAMDAEGQPMRTMNVKDGYAMQYAVKQGFLLAIITGGYSPAIAKRAEYLGIKHVYMRSSNKVEQLEHLLQETGLKAEEIVYIGDDIPDLPVMQRVALPVAPADAVPEIKQVAKYISHCRGGEGVVRDVIEQTLKAQGRWAQGNGFGW